MNLKKNPIIVYIICFLAVFVPGAYVLFGPKLKSKSVEHTEDQQFGIILIGSFPLMIFCIISLVDYYCVSGTSLVR
jgi:hypothetical protein